jgi:hypothetical protein
VPEADNLGQVLYMISLVGDRRHPLVETVLRALPDCQRDGHIVGRTDYADHPVFQTKWVKCGLRALGLDDTLKVPAVYDAYSALFWMDFKDQHVHGPRFDARNGQLFPYLAWAEAHFYGAEPPMEPHEGSTPLSWEEKATDAEFWRMAPISQKMARSQLCMPHGWHAAEMFLYFMDIPRKAP